MSERPVRQLIETPPPELARVIGLDGAEADDIVVAAASDLLRDGRYGREWVVITRQRARVFEKRDGAEWHAWFDAPLAELESVSVESLVGAVVLQVVRGGKPVELLRYTAARSRVFARAAKYLEDAARFLRPAERGAGAIKGEKPNPEPPRPPVLADDPESDRRCATCGLHLPEGSKVCPACLNKGKVLVRIVSYMRPY